MLQQLRYLLLQVRNPDDPMRQQEVNCFARSLETQVSQISVFDLLGGQLHEADLTETDVVLIGGSGHYSAAGEGDWLEISLESLRVVHDTRKPTFASCWGFQAMARAMGGRVIHDLNRAEIGVHHVCLTESGKADPVFGPSGEVLQGLMGHEDTVVELPPGTELLASTDRVENQAYRFLDRPIYCTQFHPELDRESFLGRLNTYPEYVTKISGLSLDEFRHSIHDTPETMALLKRFVQEIAPRHLNQT
ncbi:GMP synthase [glutamine-hydrolyzing] [Gimesia panareensis]|uniref:GMP synthase [glutamine-hydrolyzing] n=1 Tax=Gimesia panareensis TaxID=2527978 RepID=A0A518FVE9_9PLAN|nr:type 1 glutamine amidotransferase [Gimesia panareensis]QDV20331.1 GMP synthase [glutamine-hydrolyzing] [Gimesia panareensis]